jgi:hypothetical protein
MKSEQAALPNPCLEEEEIGLNRIRTCGLALKLEFLRMPPFIIYMIDLAFRGKSDKLGMQLHAECWWTKPLEKRPLGRPKRKCEDCWETSCEEVIMS